MTEKPAQIPTEWAIRRRPWRWVTWAISWAITPATSSGELARDLALQWDLQGNDEVDTANAVYNGCLDYVCLAHTDPVPANWTVFFALQESVGPDGDPALGLSSSTASDFAAALVGSVHFTGCSIGELNKWLSDNLGLTAFDLYVAMVEEQLEEHLADRLEALENAVQEQYVADCLP